MINNLTKVNIQGDFQVSELEFMGRNKQQIVSVGNSYFINFYDVQKLTMIKQINLENTLTSLHINKSSILVGNGKGQLLTMDPRSLEVAKKNKLHTDCLTDIFEQESKIITVGYDGLVNFIDRRSQNIINTIDLETPIKQITKFQNKYYLAGLESYTIDQEHNIESIGRYQQFLPIGKKMFGTNDHNGFTYINKNDRKYVPCQRMVAYKKGVLGTSEDAVTYFELDEEERVWWRGATTTEMEEGDSITSLLVKNSRIFAGSVCGNMYVFEFDEKYSWLMS